MVRHLLLLPLLLLACVPDGTRFLPVLANVKAEQTELMMGETEAGHEITADAWFVNEGDASATLEARLVGGEEWLSLERTSARIGAGERMALGIRFVAFAPDVQAQALLVVEQDGGDVGAMEVKVLARTKPLPSCDDHNACTLDGPDPANPSWCLHRAIHGPCDDGNACTDGDWCQDGQCIGVAISCDDHVACTADACEPAQGCVNQATHSWCEDGQPCTADACEPGVGADDQGCQHRVQPNGTLCGAPSCLSLPMCMEGECVRVTAPDGYPCDDGNGCSQGDSCLNGVCHPGDVLVQGPGVPVVVQQTDPQTSPGVAVDEQVPTSTRNTPLFGQWAVSLDAVAVAQHNGNPVVLMSWSGAKGSAAELCYRDPAHCANLPVPHGPTPPQTQVSINLSLVTLDGQAFINHVLPLDEAYKRAQSAQMLEACSWIPHGVVMQVAAASDNGSVFGAAVVNYEGSCAMGGVPLDGTPGEAVVTDRVAPVLVVFTGNASGIQLVDATLLGTSESSLLMTGRTGQPLLAVHYQGGRGAVAYAKLGAENICIPAQDCEGCTGGCSDLVVFAARRYDLNQPTDSTMYHGMEVTADVMVPTVVDRRAWNQVGELAVTWRQEAVEVTWLQRATEDSPRMTCCDPGPLESYPQTYNRYDAWHAWLREGGASEPQSFLKSWVNALGRTEDGLGEVDLWWSRQGTEHVQCIGLDLVVEDRPSYSFHSTLLSRPATAGQEITAARVAAMGARAWFMAAQVDRQLLLLSPSMDQMEELHVQIGWPVDQDVGMYPGAAPHMAEEGLIRMVGSVAEVGFNTAESARTPVLALGSLGCVTQP